MTKKAVDKYVFCIYWMIIILTAIYSAAFTVYWDRYTIPIVINFVAVLISGMFYEKLVGLITPKRNVAVHIGVSLLIFALYISLALTLSNPQLFTYLLGVFFLVANMNYMTMLNLVEDPEILKRKILLDQIGTFGVFLSYFLIVSGYPLIGEWTLCIGLFLGTCASIKKLLSL